MKKPKLGAVIFYTLSAYLSSWAGPSYAVPSYGTVMPESGKWISGTQANYIFERDVRDYKNVGSNQYFYNLSFGFTDWFSFDAKLGVGDVRTTAIDRSGSDKYRTNFAGGYGWRAKLFEDTKTKIKAIWGFEHISVHPSSKRIDSKAHDVIWDDWQFQLTAFKKLGNIYPYCGMKGSLLYIIRKIEGNRTRRQSGGYVGFIVGTDVAMNEYIYINVEGRLFDERALSAGFTVKY